MNITVDGVTRPMTPKEIADLEKERAQYEHDVSDGAIVNPSHDGNITPDEQPKPETIS